MDIAEKLQQVKQSIIEAAEKASRKPDDIQLVAVSKFHPIESIRTALDTGHRIYGENRVQEAQSKWPILRESFADIKLHLLGSLQTNKVKEAVETFDVIETVDRPKLAESLAKEMAKQGKNLEVYIQINTGEEDQKGGCLPKDADNFITYCMKELGLNVQGLMCIPPANEEPSLHFAFLREIAKRHGLARLSMGMSSDYETAIRFGATSVRVGTAIFGERP
jgi:PLP dependent protein